MSGSEGVSVSLSPKSLRPDWVCQGGLQGSWINGSIQQYKLSTYCVPGHRQGPTLMAFSLVWEEDLQIKGIIAREAGAKQSIASGLLWKAPEEGEGLTKKKE